MEDAGLPKVLGVEVQRVRYPEPRLYWSGREPRQVREGVEILVRTSGELPVRDLAPVLFIGDVPLPDYAAVAPQQYRFFVVDFSRIPPGAPIALGWPYAPAHRVDTGFRFQFPPGPAVA